MGVVKNVLVIFNEKQQTINKEEKMKDSGEESDNSNLRCYIVRQKRYISYIMILIGIFSLSNVSIPIVCL